MCGTVRARSSRKISATTTVGSEAVTVIHPSATTVVSAAIEGRAAESNQPQDRRPILAGEHQIGATRFDGEHARAVPDSVPATKPHGECEQGRRKHAKGADECDIESDQSVTRSQRRDDRNHSRNHPNPCQRHLKGSPADQRREIR